MHIVDLLYQSDRSVSFEEKEFLKQYKFKGKTLAEWYYDAQNCPSGYDKENVPFWMGAQSRFEDALVMGRLMYEVECRKRQSGGKIKNVLQSELFALILSVVGSSILMCIIYHYGR